MYQKKPTLPTEWTKEGKNLLWKVPYGGRTAPMVHKGRVFLINRAGDGISQQERVMALDLETGKVIWEHRFNVFLTDIVAHRLGWAHLTVDPETDHVYAHGVQGLFFCFDFDGKIIWKRSLTEEFGRISGYGGRTNTPIIEGNKVIINFLSSGWGPHGKPVHRFLAMDKKDGSVIWWSEPSGKPLDTTYSVPVMQVINGHVTLVAGLADGAVHGINALTGEPLWHFRMSKRGLNTSVMLDGEVAYAAHGEENLDEVKMGRVVAFKARGKGDITEKNELWRVDHIESGYASPVLDRANKVLYVSDNAGNLYAINTPDGKILWDFKYGRTAKGSGVLADGKMYIGEQEGAFHILEVSREGARKLSSQHFAKEDGSPIEVYGSPAVVGGRVLLPTNDGLYCIGTPRDGKPYKAPPRVMDRRYILPTAIQLTPAEAWVAPGEKLDFKAVLINPRGNTRDLKNPKWELKGLSGSIDNGVYTAAGGAAQEAGVVTVSNGEFSASARVRVIPALPFSEDFEKRPVELPPPGWITSKLKAKVVEFDGSRVLKKLAERPSPPFARLRCYMTPPIDAGYTVKADMYGESKKKRFIPDMGLLNSRYKLVMLGSSSMKRALRLVTWDPMPRIQKDVPFDWKADTWYSVKLSVDVVDGKAHVKGRVWPRGEKEPSDWQIEITDPHPNTGGSPGLYAYSVNITAKSHGTPVYFDNVAVTPNP